MIPLSTMPMVAMASSFCELQAAISEVKSRYNNEAKKQGMTVVRADELLSELRAVLSFLLEDGDHPEGAIQISQLRDEYDDARSHDAMALALEAYSELASQLTFCPTHALRWTAVRSSQLRGDGEGHPLDESLPKKLGGFEAPMNPMLLAAALGDWRHSAREGYKLLRVGFPD